MNFSELAGNEGLKTQLETAAKRNAFSHAYIIHGPQGSGKRTLAGLLSAALVCSGGETRPCFRCIHCMKARKGIHPDIITADAGGKELGVALIRQLRKDAYIRPNEAAKKVYILPSGETMRFAAQNAMLKVLEDGPPHAAFLILTENVDALLPTVRSRCVELGLSPLPEREVEALLHRKFPDKDAEEIRTAASRSGGFAGRGTAALQSPSEDGGGSVPEFAEILCRKNEWALFSFCMGLETTGRDSLSAFFSGCETMLTESLRLKVAGGNTHGEYGAASAGIADCLTKIEIAGTIDILRRLGGCCNNFNVGTGHMLGMLAADCWEMIH